MLKAKIGILPLGAVFDEISSYWTEMADARDTEGQLSLVKNNLKTGRLVLDLGCGSGRHAVQLNKSGYNVVGLDISPRLLKIAQMKAAKANVSLILVRADMRFLPFRANTFSGVISLDSTLGYFQSENEDRQSLREAEITLEGSGIFLIDVLNGEHMLSRQRKSRLMDMLFPLARFAQFSKLFRWREYDDFWLLQRRLIDKSSSMLHDTWVFRDKHTGKILVVRHAMHLFELEQLQRLLFESRLKVTKVYGEYNEEGFDKVSRRLILVAEKARQ